MTHPKLHVHAIGGRENGLMIIGSAEELEQFATDLQHGIRRGPIHPPAPGWPGEVLTINSESPYKDTEFQISFHVRDSALSPELSRRPRYTGGNIVFLLAVIGAVSLVVWAARLFQWP